MDWFWPLKYKNAVPLQSTGDNAHGSFGSVRRYDTHTGVDLYCPQGSLVRAVEDGVVVAIEHFTGAPESPWWNPTEAVLVEGASGVVVYGEISPHPSLTIGTIIKRKDVIGTVLKVLKKDKGYPMSMLHLELHKPGTKFTETWVTIRPETLLDPTSFLLTAYNNPTEAWPASSFFSPLTTRQVESGLTGLSVTQQIGDAMQREREAARYFWNTDYTLTYSPEPRFYVTAPPVTITTAPLTEMSPRDIERDPFFETGGDSCNCLSCQAARERSR